MATVAVPNNPTPAPLHAQKSTALAMFVGLIWGAVMLVVFGFWMRSKYAETWALVTNIFLVAGALAAGLALWQAFTLWIKNETPDQNAASLEQQRRIYSYVFLIGGIGLILMAFVLGVAKKSGNYAFVPDNFGETFGVLLFGLIALGCGYVLQMPQNDQTSPIQFLLDKVPILKMSMLVIAAISLIVLVWVFFAKRAEFTAYFPELTALLFMSMLGFACFLWLNTGGFGEFEVRMFVLIFGGSTGLILFLMSLVRAYVWRQDILLGGSVAWQGPNAWRFWLCAYVLFVSLVVMFVSFNLARADIRKNKYLRLVMYGYDALVQLFLLFAVLFILNIVIHALFPFTFEWTKSRGAYALADKSKNLIAGLKQETNVVVLLPQNSFIYKDVRNLLDNCTAVNPNKFKVKYVSPDVDQKEYEEIAEKFPAVFPETALGAVRGIIVIYGAIPKDEKDKTPYAFIAQSKIAAVEGGRQPGADKPKYVFKGESEIIKELSFLVDQQKKRKLYIVQGDGEVDINDESGVERRDFKTDLSAVGIGLLVDRLGKDNYDVTGLSFKKEIAGPKPQRNIEYKKDVPEDCHALIVAGVADPLHKDALDAIERYMKRGGKMLVFLDVFLEADANKLKNTGLEGLLERHGVKVTDEFILRKPLSNNDDPRTLLATTPKGSENELAKQFADKAIFMKRSARVIQPVDTGRFKGETVLQLDARPKEGRAFIVEKNVKHLRDWVGFLNGLFQDDDKMENAISKTPVSVAVAVTDQDGNKPRLVVIGDTEFITNRELALSKTRETNYDFTVSALGWMNEKTDTGGGIRTSDNYSIDPEVNVWRMVLLPGWLMLLGFIGLGVAIWLVRRR